MTEEAPLSLALIGAPNAGKSTLFNALTGGRAKIANYPGATVELRKSVFVTSGGRSLELIDLPGIYGTSNRSRDAEIALRTLAGDTPGEAPPDAFLLVLDASTLRTHLQIAMELKRYGKPILLVLNMMDLAERNGQKIDLGALSKALGLQVVPTQATRQKGRENLVDALDDFAENCRTEVPLPAAEDTSDRQTKQALQAEARQLADRVLLSEALPHRLTRQIDGFVLHPLLGPLILATILFFMFQAVYAWAAWPMDMIDGGFGQFSELAQTHLPAGWFRDLLTEGVIGGVGAVIIFLPQILILFAFILLLEASGYMSRAAFLMDTLMLRVGLNGRAFIPLLSSFACAIPGIMAARTIESERDRLTTIMVAPLMTCSARLPVYTLIIGAFIPNSQIGPFNQQGLVLFAMYIFGIISGFIIAFLLKKTLTKGGIQPLIMELPTYKWPQARDFFLGLWERAKAFLIRAGTIIFATTIMLWFFASYQLKGFGLVPADGLRSSLAGQIGSILEPLLKPIGFNLEIAIALIPGMAAREVAVSALGTVYAIEGGDENTEGIAAALQADWSMPTALAFLAWFVFAPQCFATLATVRRETNSWQWTAFMFAYLFAAAYLAAGTTYWIASSF